MTADSNGRRARYFAWAAALFRVCLQSTPNLGAFKSQSEAKRDDGGISATMVEITVCRPDRVKETS